MAKPEQNQKKHSFTLEDRATLSLCGVTEVISFSDSCVFLKTSLGALNIQGKNLNIGRLNTDTGDLFITGEITLMKYSKAKSNNGIFEGLFR